MHSAYFPIADFQLFDMWEIVAFSSNTNDRHFDSKTKRATRLAMTIVCGSISSAPTQNSLRENEKCIQSTIFQGFGVRLNCSLGQCRG